MGQRMASPERGYSSDFVLPWKPEYRTEPRGNGDKEPDVVDTEGYADHPGTEGGDPVACNPVPISERSAKGEDVTKSWTEISIKQIFTDCPQNCRSVDPQSTCPDGAIRFVCISDTHGLHRQLSLPAGDVLIVSGDISMKGLPDTIHDFCEWIETLPFAVKIVIAGNHDITFDGPYYFDRGQKRFRLPNVNPDELKRKLRQHCIYLEDEGVVIFPLDDGSGGIRIWGSPYQPDFFDWAFQLQRGRQCYEKWCQIPTETDILVVHGPPLGRGDACSSGLHAGCIDLLRQVQLRVRPQLVINGHIHEAYGVSSDGTTTYVNASTCNLKYQAINPPMVMDVIPHRPFKKPGGT